MTQQPSLYRPRLVKLFLLCDNARSSSYKEEYCSVSKMVPCCVTVVVEHMEGYLKKKVCFSEPHLANVGDGRRTKQGQFIPDISGMI